MFLVRTRNERQVTYARRLFTGIKSTADLTEPQSIIFLYDACVNNSESGNERFGSCNDYAKNC